MQIAKIYDRVGVYESLECQKNRKVMPLCTQTEPQIDNSWNEWTRIRFNIFCFGR